MIYLTKDDVLTRITDSNLEVITGGDDSLLDDYEIDAVNEVSSYLDHDYDISAIFPEVDSIYSTINPTIKRMTVDLMLYNMHNSRVNPRQIPENIIVKRDDAISWLTSVANPRTMTNAPFLPKKQFDEKRNNALSWGSKDKRENKY